MAAPEWYSIPRAALLECSDGYSVYTVSGGSFVRALVKVGAMAGKPEKVVQEGKTSYEIIIEKKGRKIEYTISPAGKVTAKEEIEGKGEKKEGDKKD